MAGFIGKASFLEGEFSSGGTFRSLGGLTVRCARDMPLGKGSVGLRAEHIVVGAAALSLENNYSGRVEYVGYMGSFYELRLRLNDADTLMAHIPNRGAIAEPRVGDEVSLGWTREVGMAYAD